MDPDKDTASTFKPSSSPKNSGFSKLVFASLLMLLIGALGGYMLGRSQGQNPPGTLVPPTQPPDGVACTMDAMECPDGSFVGRTGPNCEFAACPSSKIETPSVSNTPIVIPSNWKQFSADFPDLGIRLSFKLPPGYSFQHAYADALIQDDVPTGVVVDQNTPRDILYFLDILVPKYDGGSRRAFYTKYLQGEIEGVNQGEPKIISVTESPLSANSYITFVTNYNFGNPNDVHYVVVKNGTFIAFHGQQNSQGILQTNIDKILESVEVTKL